MNTYFRFVHDFLDYFAIVITAYYMWSICTISSTLLVVQMEMVGWVAFIPFFWIKLMQKMCFSVRQNWTLAWNDRTIDPDAVVIHSNFDVLWAWRECDERFQCNLWHNLPWRLVSLFDENSTHAAHNYDSHWKTRRTARLWKYSVYTRSVEKSECFLDIKRNSLIILSAFQVLKAGFSYYMVLRTIEWTLSRMVPLNCISTSFASLKLCLQTKVFHICAYLKSCTKVVSCKICVSSRTLFRVCVSFSRLAFTINRAIAILLLLAFPLFINFGKCGANLVQ